LRRSYLQCWVDQPGARHLNGESAYLPATECFHPDNFFSASGGDTVDPGGVLELDDSAGFRYGGLVLGCSGTGEVVAGDPILQNPGRPDRQESVLDVGSFAVLFKACTSREVLCLRPSCSSVLLVYMAETVYYYCRNMDPSPSTIPAHLLAVVVTASG
jgi:hypothetical protein